MHYYRITLFEKRTVEVFQKGESASEVGKQALNDAEKGSLDWALAVGKKEYYAQVALADDIFAKENTSHVCTFKNDSQALQIEVTGICRKD